jgi:thioredoxin-dependent peroxiredoxin
MKAKKTNSKSTTKSNPKTNTKSNPKPNTKIRNRTKSKPKTPKQMEGKQIPNITLDTRVRNSKLKGNNPFKWEKVQTKDLFKNKKIVLFSLPGAYTPTCSNSHLPDYDKKYNQLINRDIDDVYCLSVNDAFVMYNWGKQLNINNVKLLPDGNALFTKKMGALVKKNNLGFGDRSWRYSMLVDDGKIIKVFSEPGYSNNCSSDPFEVSDVDNMLKYLSSNN